MLRLLIWGMRGGACREESGGGAGWGIVEGAIGCLSVVVVGARVRLSKPPWLFVMVVWWVPWMLVGARRRLSIMVVGSRGPSSEVVGGHRRRASMVVLGTRGRWWAVVAVSQSSWWVLVANVDGGGGCEKRAVVTGDITFVTSPNWDVSNCPNVSLLPCYFLYSATLCRHSPFGECAAVGISSSWPMKRLSRRLPRPALMMRVTVQHSCPTHQWHALCQTDRVVRVIFVVMEFVSCVVCWML